MKFDARPQTGSLQIEGSYPVSSRFRPWRARDQDSAALCEGRVQKLSDLSPDADESWDKVVPELERLELVGEANFAGLIAMAECYARMTQATRIIRNQGVMGHDPDKGKHPAIAVVEDASRNLRGFMASFGILPADEGYKGRES